MIELKNITIKLRDILLDNVSLECKKGEIVSIAGSSGSGKTSLIKFIIGELDIQEGTIIYNNTIINENNRNDFLFNVISYIDQFSSYYPNMSIYAHFKYYAKLYNIKINKKDVINYLSKVRLEKISLWNSPSKLSTGERKRFLIALALMLKKEVIILDEPTASLDQQNINTILDVIKELSDTGISFLISTHNKEVMDISDVIYEINNKKLIKTVHKEKQNTISINEYNKPRKINYSRYKNMRQRLLFVFILLLGGITISFVSLILSQTIVYNIALNKDVPTYKNNLVYIEKPINLKESYSNYYKPFRQQNTFIWDIMNEHDYNKILEIDGVKEIRKQLIIESNSTIAGYANGEGTRPLNIYKNGKLIKNDDIRFNENGKTKNKTIFAVGYYNDDINIDGTYINDTLYEMIEIENVKDIEIEYDAIFIYDYHYSYDNEGNRFFDNDGSTEKITIPLDGVINKSEYHDARFMENDPIIYIPIDQLKEIIKNNKSLKDRGIVIEDNIFDIMTKSCTVVCEEGKDEEVMLAINELGGFFAQSPYYSDNEMLNMLDMQNTASLSIALLFSFLLISSVTLLISYYIRSRKDEMILLKRNGLGNNILRYLSQDNYIMIVVWLVMSASLWFTAYLYTPIKDYASIEMHMISWCIITIIFIIVILVIKRYLLIRQRKKMIL